MFHSTSIFPISNLCYQSALLQCYFHNNSNGIFTNFLHTKALFSWKRENVHYFLFLGVSGIKQIVSWVPEKNCFCICSHHNQHPSPTTHPSSCCTLNGPSHMRYFGFKTVQFQITRSCPCCVRHSSAPSVGLWNEFMRQSRRVY